MEKYQNRYRIPSARAQWWDYGWNGAYFITICTRDRQHFLGAISNDTMVLSPLGAIADVLWHEIPCHRPVVELGDFVVMPNHIHGILILAKPEETPPVETGRALSPPNGRALSPPDGRALSPPDGRALSPPDGHALSLPSPNIGQTRFQNIGENSVSSIVGAYKSAVTKHANRLGLENGWQVRFHDHIIRNDAEYQRISDYIIANPANWGMDKFYSP